MRPSRIFINTGAAAPTGGLSWLHNANTLIEGKMLKNTAGQNITALILDTDGAIVATGTTTVYVTGDAGTQTSMGTATYKANGEWTIDVTQAESNYDDIGFTWVNDVAGSVVVHQHVFTDQTYDRVGAPAGASVSADIADVPTVSEFNARTLAAASYFDPAADTVANVTTVATTTDLTNLPTIPANWLTAAGIAANALDNKGNWELAGVAPTVAEITADVWDEATATARTPGTYGQLLKDNIDAVLSAIETDTAQIGVAGAGLTAITGVQLAADQEVDATKFGGAPVTATTSVTIPAASTLATTTNITAGQITTVTGAVNGSVGSVAGNVDGTVSDVANLSNLPTIPTNWITSDGIAAGAITDTEFTATGSGLSALALSAAGVDAIWDEDIVAAHNTADTAGAILNNILPEKNAAFNNLEFLWVAASDHVTPVTGATTMSVTRSIDGGAFGSGTGTGPVEVGNGIYQYDASAADMNGTIITFRFVATGGTPGAPDDAFVTVKTSG